MPGHLSAGFTRSDAQGRRKVAHLMRGIGALLTVILVSAGFSVVSNAATGYVICENQTYALCASAEAFVYQEVSYAKCIIKRGNSISAPPLTYQSNGSEKNICDVNAFGAANEYMMSTFSLPEQVKKGGNQALYTCPGGSTGDYAQCDGGTCFKSSTGQFFPGVGKVANDEIICSCPITKPTTSNAPFGYQFIGPYPCQKQAFSVCSQNARNGDIIPVGSPPGAGRLLTGLLYGRQFRINECASQ